MRNTRSYDVNDSRVEAYSPSVRRGVRVVGSIEEYQNIAQQRGGKCLSEVYVNSVTGLVWECERGHSWIAKPVEIKRGTWCKKCKVIEGRGLYKPLTIDVAKRKAFEVGFELLGNYINSYEPTEFRHIQCGTHQITTLHNLTRFCACTACNQRPKIDEYEIHTLVKSKHGKVVGIADSSTKNSTWECHVGHQWRATWSSVKKGGWCPICAGKKSLSKLHRKAKDKLYQHKRTDAVKGYPTDDLDYVTVEDIIDVMQQTCVYCGNIATNFDRKDSNLPHLKINCVPCCGRCNGVKSNKITYEIMLEVGQIFRNHKI